MSCCVVNRYRLKSSYQLQSKTFLSLFLLVSWVSPPSWILHLPQTGVWDCCLLLAGSFFCYAANPMSTCGLNKAWRINIDLQHLWPLLSSLFQISPCGKKSQLAASKVRPVHSVSPEVAGCAENCTWGPLTVFSHNSLSYLEPNEQSFCYHKNSLRLIFEILQLAEELRSFISDQQSLARVRSLFIDRIIC